jgi:hypothetical protein
MVLSSSTLVGSILTIWEAMDADIPSSFSLLKSPSAFSGLSFENFVVYS